MMVKGILKIFFCLLSEHCRKPLPGKDREMAGILPFENVPEVFFTVNAIPGLRYDRADDPSRNGLTCT